VNLRNTERWGPVSQLLHWTIVVLVAGMAIVGLSLDSLPKTPRYFWVYDLHKSTGLAVLALALLRLGWRLYAGTPPPVPGIPAWQRRLARTIHVLLYLLLLAMPLSGWLYDSASGLRPLRWFGLFPVPKLAAPDEVLAGNALAAHELLFWLLLALVMVHAAAAVYHHAFRGDATLARMLPRGWLDAGQEKGDG
jgi:cytochrome b561